MLRVGDLLIEPGAFLGHLEVVVFPPKGSDGGEIRRERLAFDQTGDVAIQLLAAQGLAVESVTGHFQWYEGFLASGFEDGERRYYLVLDLGDNFATMGAGRRFRYHAYCISRVTRWGGSSVLDSIQKISPHVVRIEPIGVPEYLNHPDYQA